MTRIAQLPPPVARSWYHPFHSDLTAPLTQHVRQPALASVKIALETALAEELTAYLGAAPDARSAGGPTPARQQRAGRHRRQVRTTSGYLPDRRVPRRRAGKRDRPGQIRTRYQLALPAVLDQARYRYPLGRSIRDRQEARDRVFGHGLSRAAVHRVPVAAQRGMDAWREPPITATPPILIVAGVWVQVLAPTGSTWRDRSGHDRREMRGQDQVVLAVMGGWPDGRHQLRPYHRATAEATASWSASLTALIQRGLDPSAVRMVVRDGTSGLPAARAQHLPHAPQRRCTVHKIRGLERQFCYRDRSTTDPATQESRSCEQARRQRRQPVTTDAHAIFAAPTRAAAEARRSSFRTTMVRDHAKHERGDFAQTG